MSIQQGQRIKHLELKVAELEQGVGNLAGLLEGWEDRIDAMEAKLEAIPRANRRKRPVDGPLTEEVATD